MKLTIAALLPVAATVVLWLLDHKTRFGHLKNPVKQLIFGLIFGGLAVIGTEWGIPLNGAQVNCRDAAVLVAGLLFGAPAGIIAGVIGGVERYIAVAWGVGAFTQIGCSVSTLAAGIIAAVLRKYMFEDKKPGVVMALFVGVVVEVFHLTMIFFTNISDMEGVMAVERACTVPMVTANGLSVMFATLAVTLLSGKSKVKTKPTISTVIQRGLLVTILLALVFSSLFIGNLENRVADSQINKLLDIALNETAGDIEDASNENLLALTRTIALRVGKESLSEIASDMDVPEISVINEAGFIVDSTNTDFLYYDMSSGEQSTAFLCLLYDETEYVQKYGPISYNSSVYRKYAGVRHGNGFVQVGYDAERFQKEVDRQIVGITKNRHVGETGFILILDEKMDVVSAPDNIDVNKINGGQAVETLPETGVTFRNVLVGRDIYYKLTEVEGYAVVAVLPAEEALKNRDIALFLFAFMDVLIFAVLFFLIYLMIRKTVVNPVKKVNRSLERITEGNLDERVNASDNAELALLSEDINSTVDTLKTYIDAEAEKISKELLMAKTIQASAVPGVFPAFPKRKDFDIFASMTPAKEVGGDFYDFYFTEENKLHFVIADVSGKGIPAAMFMMRALTELKSLTQSDLPVSDVFTKGNEALCEGNEAGMFVTAWQGGVDLKNGILKFANAGHNPPLVKHGDGSFEYLKAKSGFILAGMEGVMYRENELKLTPGDIVFLYTDGVTEATNGEQKLYGEERLRNTLNNGNFGNMDELCKTVKEDVDAFVGEAPQFDDITMVAFRYLGPPNHPEITVENASVDDIPRITEFAEAELEKIGCPMKTVLQIDVAIDEIVSNIVNHGYGEKKGPVNLRIVYKEEKNEVYLRFSDEGVPYNPLTNADPDVTLSAEERKIGGLGIFMVKKTMDAVMYKYEDGRNVFTIMKKTV